MKITNKQYGSRWPFTVNELKVKHKKDGSIYYVCGGIKYAANPCAEERKDTLSLDNITIDKTNTKNVNFVYDDVNTLYKTLGMSFFKHYVSRYFRYFVFAGIMTLIFIMFIIIDCI